MRESKAERKLRDFCETQGFTVDVLADAVCVECRPGHHFYQLHELVTAFADGEQPRDTWAAAYRDLMEQIPHIEPCGPACEWWDSK